MSYTKQRGCGRWHRADRLLEMSNLWSFWFRAYLTYSFHNGQHLPGSSGSSGSWRIHDHSFNMPFRIMVSICRIQQNATLWFTSLANLVGWCWHRPSPGFSQILPECRRWSSVSYMICINFINFIYIARSTASRRSLLYPLRHLHHLYHIYTTYILYII